MLDVPVGTMGKELESAYAKKVMAANQLKRSTEDLEQAYEILKNVTSKVIKVKNEDGSLSEKMVFSPNPAFYREYYDRINRVKEKKRRVYEKEYKGRLKWLYVISTFLWLVIGQVMFWAPLSWCYLNDTWGYLICFSPLYYGFYHMYFKVMNWRKFRFEKDGKAWY